VVAGLSKEKLAVTYRFQVQIEFYATLLIKSVFPGGKNLVYVEVVKIP